MPVGQVVPYDDARRLARSNQWREKVLVGGDTGGDADGLVPRGEGWRGRRGHDLSAQLLRSGPGQPHGWIRLGRRAATPFSHQEPEPTIWISHDMCRAARAFVGRWGAEVNLRAILLHMVQETARHNGHADILRETINGTTGH